VEIRLLGALEVVEGSRSIAVAGGRQRALLTVLALNPSAVVSVDRLVEELWGDRQPSDPANALQIAVGKLRRSIGADIIARRPPGYVLTVSEDDVDARRFERLANEGRAEIAAGRQAEATARFDRALALWRGEPLAEFGELPMARAAASRLHELRASVQEDRFDALLATGQDAQLVPDIDAAIAAAPFRERLRRQLMLALYRCGRQADALRAFAEARLVLGEELGLEPGVELRQLESAILNQDPSLQVPPTAAGAAVTAPAPPNPPAPTNLRPALTSFVGRERDAANVTELIRRNRLVTLLGPGGSGKTRLATEVASRHVADYADGVWFAALDTIGSDGVANAVAAALGLPMADPSGQLASTSPSIDRLRNVLAGRTALIVLDNCEHVIDDAAELATELMASVPGVRLIATSREALRVAGEVVWTVPALEVDDAVTLFTERANAAGANLDARAVDRADVAELCRRVDCMPLAIELTAARTNAFSVPQLIERLDDRFRLLTGGVRTALPRQQTLRAVTDWSYDLLFEDERLVFERASVFVGGFRMEDAEVVCADDRLPARDVGPLLGRLVDKSLLVPDRSGRFKMLLTLAQYGQERLADHGHSEAARNRHAAHYLQVALPSFGDWQSPGGRSQAWWLARLADEHDNLRAALEWSISTGDAETAQLLGGHLAWYWWHAGHSIEGQRWLERALALSDPTPPSVRARAVTWSAWLSMLAGAWETASVRADEAISLGEQSGDIALVGLAWVASAQFALFEGRQQDAAQHFARGHEAHVAAGQPWNTAIAAALRSRSARLRGDVAAAVRDIHVSIDGFRAIGDHANLIASLDHLSQMLQMQGDIDGAQRTVEEALALSGERALRGWSSPMSARLGSLALSRGDLQAAAGQFEVALRTARELGLPLAEAAAIEGLACVAAASDDHELAAALFGHADQFRRGTLSPTGDRLAEVGHAESSARAALGDDRYHREHDAGRTADLDDLLSRVIRSTPRS
jgi:predicted ATPase/DNA-binding SARP family transcriptional activator